MTSKPDVEPTEKLRKLEVMRSFYDAIMVLAHVLWQKVAEAGDAIGNATGKALYHTLL
jgi:hypothetical protein